MGSVAGTDVNAFETEGEERRGNGTERERASGVEGTQRKQTRRSGIGHVTSGGHVHHRSKSVRNWSRSVEIGLGAKIGFPSVWRSCPHTSRQTTMHVQVLVSLHEDSQIPFY